MTPYPLDYLLSTDDDSRFADEKTKAQRGKAIALKPPSRPRTADKILFEATPCFAKLQWEPGFKALTCMMFTLLLKIFT
jgi:hypothetical protein